MRGNRSLDEFADAGADAVEADRAAGADEVEDGPADDGEADGTEAADEGADPDPVEPDPPASTYVWAPGGGDCAACGATVEERWRDGDGLVCADCKAW